MIIRVDAIDSRLSPWSLSTIAAAIASDSSAIVGRGEVGGGGAGEAHRGQISAANNVTIFEEATVPTILKSVRIMFTQEKKPSTSPAVGEKT